MGQLYAPVVMDIYKVEAKKMKEMGLSKGCGCCRRGIATEALDAV